MPPPSEEDREEFYKNFDANLLTREGRKEIASTLVVIMARSYPDLAKRSDPQTLQLIGNLIEIFQKVYDATTEDEKSKFEHIALLACITGLRTLQKKGVVKTAWERLTDED